MNRSLKLILGFTLLFLGSKVNAQGEQLFKSKCNTCHMVDKNSTGPNLKGVKQKWAEAGEADLLYKWVENSAGLIASGKSKMANAIKDFSASAMSPQTVTKDEVDAILDYVDTYAPPAPPSDTTTVGATSVELKPNYADNLDLFYFLLVTLFVELVAIIIMSNSIITLVKSDFFKKKVAEKGKQGGNLLGVLLVIGFLLAQNTASALTFTSPGESKEKTLWLLVENSDIYLVVVIDLILLGVIIYLRSLFKQFFRMVVTEKEKKTEKPALQKINKVLTDAVPIAQEEKIMLHHEYDGIRELDNNLPPWWVWGFVATIVFAVVYLFNYHVLGASDLQIKAYEKDMKKSEREVKAYLAKMAMNVDENTATLLTDASAISAGKALFTSNCVTCHNPNGEGNIGPNLTDKNWIYGFDIKEVFGTIKKGTPNGMPEHNSKLNPVQIQQVASFILQLPEAKGKAAEGTIIEK